PALAAFDRTDECLKFCSVSEYESARTQVCRALLYRELERYDEALSLVRAARRTFMKYGDAKRVADSQSTEAAVLMAVGKYRDAVAIHLAIAADAARDDETHACAWNNAALCYIKLSQFDDAKKLFAQAMSTFARLGLVSRHLTSRWGLARAFAEEG